MAADKSLYRITYDNGAVKLATRKVLGAHRSSPYWCKHPVKIERAPEPVFDDVTSEFIKESS